MNIPNANRYQTQSAQPQNRQTPSHVNRPSPELSPSDDTPRPAFSDLSPGWKLTLGSIAVLLACFGDKSL